MNIFSSGYKIVAGPRTTTYSRAISVQGNIAGAIFDANYGIRHWIDAEADSIFNVAYSGDPQTNRMSRGEAVRAIKDSILGVNNTLLF